MKSSVLHTKDAAMNNMLIAVVLRVVELVAEFHWRRPRKRHGPLAVSASKRPKPKNFAVKILISSLECQAFHTPALGNIALA